MKTVNLKNVKNIFLLMISVIWLIGCGATNVAKTDKTSTGSTDETLTAAIEEDLVAAVDEEIITDAEASQDTITETIEHASQKTTFLLTDAPSDDFKSVLIDIASPIVVTMDNGVVVDVPLPDNLPVRVDLLELDEVSDLLTDAALPAGTISTVALTLSNPEITLLDDTVLDNDDIDLSNPILTISLNEGVVVSEGDGATVQIDIDVEASIQIDVTTGRPIFRPVGDVIRVDDTTHPDGIEIRQIKGGIVEIPGIPDNPQSFVLKHHGRRHFIPVDASEATIHTFSGAVTFDDLTKGQIVEVGGVIRDHVLKARHILILPKDHRALRGVITQLDPTAQSFELVFWKRHDRDAEHTAQDIRQVTVSYTDATHIALEHPRMELTASDLTNGQLVFVRGGVNLDLQTVDARFIVIQPERFRGFIIDEPNCAEHLIRVANPSWHLHRLRVAGIELAPHRSGIVDISGAKLFRRDGVEIGCDDLDRGDAVGVFGLMVPHTPTDDDPNPIRVKAFKVKRAHVRHLGGEVVSVAEDGRSLILRVSEGMHGFDRLADVCTNVATAAETILVGDNGESLTLNCDHFDLKVILSDYLYNPDGIVFDISLVGQEIHMAGFFESRRRAINNPDRQILFFAVAVESGPVPVDPTDPAASDTTTGT